MIRTVALYIPALDVGGAERQLLELAKGMHKGRWRVLILTNFINQAFADEVDNLEGLKVILLNRRSIFLYPFRLLSALYREKPCLINSYLLGAQTYTLLVRLFLPKIKIVFSIRDATDYSEYHGAAGIFFKMLIEKSSLLVNRYIFNSAAGRMKRCSLPDTKICVVPNGIDTCRFHPDPTSREFVRRATGSANEALLVGIVANFSIYKGYDTFIRAARVISSRIANVKFIAVGNCDSILGTSMLDLVDELNLTGSFHFLGSRPDVNRLLAGFDVLCSSSVTEGFSNAICEGMSCGVPCVVTAVGDSAVIVGDTGIVVPPSDPDRLAAGIVKLLQLPPEERRLLGEAARSRIVEQFSVERMVSATENVYEQLLNISS